MENWLYSVNFAQAFNLRWQLLIETILWEHRWCWIPTESDQRSAALVWKYKDGCRPNFRFWRVNGSNEVRTQTIQRWLCYILKRHHEHYFQLVLMNNQRHIFIPHHQLKMSAYSACPNICYAHRICCLRAVIQTTFISMFNSALTTKWTPTAGSGPFKPLNHNHYQHHHLHQQTQHQPHRTETQQTDARTEWCFPMLSDDVPPCLMASDGRSESGNNAYIEQDVFATISNIAK